MTDAAAMHTSITKSIMHSGLAQSTNMDDINGRGNNSINMNNITSTKDRTSTAASITSTPQKYVTMHTMGRYEIQKAQHDVCYIARLVIPSVHSRCMYSSHPPPL
jgi:hypothetical protein